jgi:hypothetical protein
MCDSNENIPAHGKPMEVINVNGAEYELRLSPRPLLDADGVRCELLIDHHRRIIWLDPHGYSPGAFRLIVAASVATAHAWAEVAAGEHVEPWQGIRRHLLRARGDHLHSLAEDFAAVAGELGYPPETLLAMALHAATNWDADEAARALADLRIHYAAAGAARAEDSSPRPAPTGEHDRLPRGEMALLARDVLSAEWRMLAPPGWKMPADLPVNVELLPPTRKGQPIDGLPPLIMQRHGDDRFVFCPHCCRRFRKFSTMYRLHLAPVHGWGRDAQGYAVPPELVAPPPSPAELATRRAERLALLQAVKLAGPGRMQCPHCPRSFAYGLPLRNHVEDVHQDRALADALRSEEGHAFVRALRSGAAQEQRRAA